MKRNRSKGAWFVAIVGLALIAASLYPLLSAGDALVYAALAPATGEEMQRLVERKDEALKSMADTLRASAVGAVRTHVDMASDSGGSATVTLYGVGESWFEVCPEFLTRGRLITQTELKNGEAVVALDEKLAFQLFPTQDPIDRQVTIEGVKLRVVGVLRHSREIGDADWYRAFAPLLATKDVRFETVSLSAEPLPNSGASVMYETTAREGWLADGTLYNMSKETMRCLLPLRLLALVFGVAAVVAVLRRANRFAQRRYGRIREKLREEYAVKLLPGMLGNALLCAAVYAAVFGCGYLMAYWLVQPLYVFTEWVPENIVKWSSIRSVFWNLMEKDAELVGVYAPRMRELAFWGGTLRWGTLTALCGALLLLAHGRTERTDSAA